MTADETGIAETDDDEERRVWRAWWRRVVTCSLAVIAAVLVGWAAWVAFTRAQWAVDSDHEVRWFEPASGNWVYVLVLAGVMAGGALIHAAPKWRRLWRMMPTPSGVPEWALWTIVALAGLAGVLGFASFLPCTGEETPVLSPATWTILLFAGEFEESVIGPGAEGAACEGALPLALQMARFAAIAATFLGAVVILLVVSRDRIARALLRFSRDVDVVAGLDELSAPLVRALVIERDSRRLLDEWYDQGRREKRRSRRSGRVVVIHPRRDDTLASEVAEAGAIVVAGDPMDVGLLRTLVWRGWRRKNTSLRRFFAVSDDQRANLEIVKNVREALREPFSTRRYRNKAGRTGGGEPGVDSVDRDLSVPRIVVRLQDPREAKDWRLARVDVSEEWFEDALTVDDLVAEAISERVIDSGAEQLVIAGDSALSVAIIDTLIWRSWQDIELGRQSPKPLREIHIVGRRADRIYTEWKELRTPVALAACGPTREMGSGEPIPSVPRVDFAVEDWEIFADNLLSLNGNAALVVTETRDAALVRATRLARMYGDALVLAPDDRVNGLSDPHVDNKPEDFVIRYGPTLLHKGLAPEDSWTQLARLQHNRYSRPALCVAPASGRQWLTLADPADQRLPEFYREDNLRQHRKILRVVGADPEWGWRVVRANAHIAGYAPEESQPWLEHVSDELLRSIAEQEHQRWCALRESLGWSGVVNAEMETQLEEYLKSSDSPCSHTEADDRTKCRRARRKQWLERRRVNEYLRDWATAEPIGSTRLRSAGRLGTELEEARDDLQRNNIESVREILRSLYYWGVVAVRTPQLVQSPVSTPEPKPDGQRFRRVGQARAVQLEEAREWRTSTGDVLYGHAGDWLVTSADGSERTVADHEFGALYEPVSGSTYQRRGSVTARRTTTREPVATLEGRAHAEPGDWIVTDDRGNSWPVPAEEFDRSYEAE